jgi:two-component system, NarL family, response regulator NreC
MAIRILLADDHTLVRETLSNFLQDQEDMEVVGQAKDGSTALELTGQLQPDVVIMDVSMPPILSGLEATRWICGNWPNVKVIALSMHKQKQYVSEMLKAGARGYLLKDCDSDELLAAIRNVVQGEVYVSASIDISKSSNNVVGQ